MAPENMFGYGVAAFFKKRRADAGNYDDYLPTLYDMSLKPYFISAEHEEAFKKYHHILESREKKIVADEIRLRGKLRELSRNNWFVDDEHRNEFTKQNGDVKAREQGLAVWNGELREREAWIEDLETKHKVEFVKANRNGSFPAWI